MRRDNLTKKKLTYLPTYLSSSLREHHERAIQETCDLSDTEAYASIFANLLQDGTGIIYKSSPLSSLSSSEVVVSASAVMGWVAGDKKMQLGMDWI